MDAQHKATILVAEDDPEIRALLSIRLANAGFNVLEAADGNETLLEVRNRFPDLILLDVMMPGKNGWEVAKELRHDPRFRDIGIIMLTAIGSKINELTSPLYGADAYLDKPFDFGELESKINAVLASRREA